MSIRSIAVAYDSPRTKTDPVAFYRLLRNAETLETDKITSELLIFQDNKPLRVEKTAAEFHIQEDLDTHRLKIYVPEDPDSQDVAFNTKLPNAFCDWMVRDPTTQVLASSRLPIQHVFQSVLNSTRVEALAKTLDYYSLKLLDAPVEEIEELERTIAQPERDTEQPGRPIEQAVGEADQPEGQVLGVAGPARPQTPLQPTPELRVARTPASHHSRSSSDSESLGSGTMASSIPSPEVRAHSGNSGTSYLSPESNNHSTVVVAPSTQTALSPVPEPQSPNPGSASREYMRLLRRTVDAATRAVFPSCGVFNMSALRASLGGLDADDDEDEWSYRLQSSSKLERDKQVGAAGELFVRPQSPYALVFGHFRRDSLANEHHM
jgi:hypothetical protein